MGVVGQVNGRIGTQEAAKTRGHRKHALGAMHGNRAEGERSRWPCLGHQTVSGLGEYGQVERSLAEQCMERPSSGGGEGTKVRMAGDAETKNSNPSGTVSSEGLTQVLLWSVWWLYKVRPYW